MGFIDKMPTALTTALVLLTTLVAANAAAQLKKSKLDTAINGFDTFAKVDAPVTANAAPRAAKALKKKKQGHKWSRWVIDIISDLISSGASVSNIQDEVPNKNSSDKLVECNTSVAQAVSGFESVNYRVKYMLEIINFTNQPLRLVRSEVHTGHMHTPPSPTIMPGRNESYIVHNAGRLFTGAVGAVGYRIGSSNNVVTISISCPYNFDLGSNTLGLSIYQWNVTEVKKMSGNHIFKKMEDIDKTYPEKKVNKGESLTYLGPYESAKRKNFYDDTIALLVNDDAGEYLIRGRMGKSHKSIVKISLFPTDPNRLAPNL